MNAVERTQYDTDENHQRVEAVRKNLHDMKLPTTRFCPHTATWGSRYYTCTRDHHEGRTHEMRNPQGVLMATWVSPRLFVYELPEPTSQGSPGFWVEWDLATVENAAVQVNEDDITIRCGEDSDSYAGEEEIGVLEADALRLLAAIAEHRARRAEKK